MDIIREHRKINGRNLIKASSLEENDSTSSYDSGSGKETSLLDLMMSSKSDEELFCVCRRPFDENGEDQMMIECDSCKDWLHGKCVDISIRMAADIETYVCPRCINGNNQIIYKKFLNNHRHDYSDPQGHKKPMQAGTKAFVEKLLQRSFPDAIESNIVVKIKDGSELTIDYIERNGFKKPLLIEDKTKLNFLMPNANEIDLTQIETIVGSHYEIDVIDVERQESFPMKISELNEYFQTQPRLKTYNLISFEISKTKLTQDITAPKFVCDISWASNNIWPEPEISADKTSPTKTSSNFIEKPDVQKYCLIGAGNSYTDFHVDFGGSSVWYHIVKGEKVFYLIEPTAENLKIYEKWLCVKNHSEIFLGDKVKNCYIFRITEGNTIFLPTGWIHAVYTPCDTLVFGGNFLHSYNIPLQLKVYDMEVRLKTPEKFRFPAFETFQWYAAKYHQQRVKEANAERRCIKASTLSDIKYLREQLKRWLDSKNFYELHDYHLPRHIDGEKLVNMMNRELTKAEVLLKSKPQPAESSLKIKLKLNPNNLASSTSTLITNDRSLTDTKPKTKKEVLTFAPNEQINEIKLDPISNESLTSQDTEQPPIRLVMKIPKAFTELADACERKLEKTEVKPIKLKIKNKNSVLSAEVKNESSSESDADEKIKNEDDELMNELKNSYQDNDFFYPSLKSCGTTKRTAKKLKTEANSAATSATDVKETEEKQPRKRKIKPHASEYLEAKQEDMTPYVAADEQESEKMPKKNMLEKMIEKNLKEASQSDLKDSTNDSKTGSDDDMDFHVEDEDDLDYDQEFKIKCEQNLKLSKKLKTKSVKHQKKLESQETGDGASSSKSATDPTAKSANQLKKSKKKGYATTKQRLGKLLKLNRLVNI